MHQSVSSKRVQFTQDSAHPSAGLPKTKRTIALSTYEAEYMATLAALQYILWLQRILSKFLPTFASTRLPFQSYNGTTVKISTNKVKTNLHKQIYIRSHNLHTFHLKNRIKVSHIPSIKNPTDVLTKPILPHLHH